MKCLFSVPIKAALIYIILPVAKVGGLNETAVAI